MLSSHNPFMGIKVRDRVTIKNQHGQERTGRVVMTFPTHVVLNLGGAHGTPGVANERNIVAINGRRVA